MYFLHYVNYLVIFFFVNEEMSIYIIKNAIQSKLKD